MKNEIPNSPLDLLRHRQNNTIWSPIALAIGEKIALAILRHARCNNFTN